MSNTLIIICLLVAIPFTALFALILNISSAKKIAELNFKKLTKIEKREIRNKEINMSFILAYFSKKKLSELMILNMCKSEENKDTDNS